MKNEPAIDDSLKLSAKNTYYKLFMSGEGFASVLIKIDILRVPVELKGKTAEQKQAHLNDIVAVVLERTGIFASNLAECFLDSPNYSVNPLFLSEHFVESLREFANSAIKQGVKLPGIEFGTSLYFKLDADKNVLVDIKFATSKPIKSKIHWINHGGADNFKFADRVSQET